jgi:hypothetical protein
MQLLLICLIFFCFYQSLSFSQKINLKKQIMTIQISKSPLKSTNIKVEKDNRKNLAAVLSFFLLHSPQIIIKRKNNQKTNE